MFQWSVLWNLSMAAELRCSPWQYRGICCGSCCLSQLLWSSAPSIACPQEGSVPRTQVRLNSGDTLTVDSLAGVVQLNALRSFLAEGFQLHLQVGTHPNEHAGYSKKDTTPKK